MGRYLKSVREDPAYQALNTREDKIVFINSMKVVPRGKLPMLSWEEERFLVFFITERDRLSVGVSSRQLSVLLRDAIHRRRGPDSTLPEPKCSTTYMRGLKGRHEHLAEFKASPMDSYRAAAGATRKLEKFNENHRYVNRQMMEQGPEFRKGIPPERQWNMDEVSF